jgi:hypothetical protein
MAGKRTLVLATLVLAVSATTLNDSKKKKITIAPVDAVELAEEFKMALHEETPLLEEESKLEQEKSLIASKNTVEGKPAKGSKSVESLSTEVWASDFEKDVTQLILGLSAGGLAATPFGDSVQKISYIIEFDMMPKVMDAHNFTLTKLNELWADIEATEVWREGAKASSDELQVTYTTESTQHKSCREVEATLYETNVKCHEDWRVAKEEMVLKCNLYDATAEEVGESTANQAIVEKAPSEDVHTSVARITDTICGHPQMGPFPRWPDLLLIHQPLLLSHHISCTSAPSLPWQHANPRDTSHLSHTM